MQYIKKYVNINIPDLLYLGLYHEQAHLLY